jgi:hypothetical protein
LTVSFLLQHPLVLTGALILDLLAIHPVADGSVFETKNAYYARLYESQRRWGATGHQPGDDPACPQRASGFGPDQGRALRALRQVAKALRCTIG